LAFVESVAKRWTAVEALIEGTHNGDVHGRRYRWKITTVDVVAAWVDGFLRPACSATGQLNRSFAVDDLVGVHVGLGARTGLEDHQREPSSSFSGDDLPAA
jgi:hypothetical protein